jgi:hypothetical protein
MTSLARDSSVVSVASATDAPAPPADRTLSGRLSALYNTILASRAARAASVGEAALADLNDETLLDLGFDPASVRPTLSATFSSSDPMARFYL